jgi:hypothetical protein
LLHMALWSHSRQHENSDTVELIHEPDGKGSTVA